MKVTNLTPFDTGRLREIAQHVLEREMDPEQRHGIAVHFVVKGARTAAARKARTAGYYRRAVGTMPPGLRFNQAIVRIPRQRGTNSPKEAAQTVALLLAHEFAEMRGRSHAEMRRWRSRYFFKYDWRNHYAWAVDLPLTESAV